MFNPKCGSLAKIGRPDFVLEPATAQLLLPLFLLGATGVSTLVLSRAVDKCK